MQGERPSAQCDAVEALALHASPALILEIMEAAIGWQSSPS